MSASIVYISLAVGLFLLSYLMKRRFGVLGLGLAAGALISEHWTSIVTPFLEQQGVDLIAPPLATVVAIVLTLAPAIILLISGPTYGKGVGRIVGSLLFTFLALAFIVPNVGDTLEFDQASTAIYSTIEDYSPLIVVVGLAAAVIDVLFSKSPKKHKTKKSDH